MCDSFFSLKFSECTEGILTQRIYNVRTIFCQLCDVKNGGQPQQANILGQLATSEL